MTSIEKGIIELISLTKLSKNKNKDLVRNLTKEMKDLCNENFKMLKMSLKMVPENGKAYQASVRLIL